MSAPLRDASGGRLKGWPGGATHFPDGRVEYTFRPVRPGEVPQATVLPGDPKERVSCKYCYKNGIRPLWLHEHVPMKDGRILRSKMMICAKCGSGLEPSIADEGNEVPDWFDERWKGKGGEA
jgi:hypothetical protein